MFDGGDAAPRRSHDRFHLTALDQGAEHVEEVGGQLPCLLPVSGVEGRLSATGLALGEDHVGSVSLEQLGGGHADTGIQGVHHAGDEECDRGPGADGRRVGVLHGAQDVRPSSRTRGEGVVGPKVTVGLHFVGGLVRRAAKVGLGRARLPELTLQWSTGAFRVGPSGRIVQWASDTAQMSTGHVGVDLGGANAGVAQ